MKYVVFILIAVGIFWGTLKAIEDDKILPIKGNAPQMIYHLSECPSYFSVIIKEDQGDKLFKTEQEAMAAGFNKAKNCP